MLMKKKPGSSRRKKLPGLKSLNTIHNLYLWK